jgi:hypothetical protein
MTSSPDSEARRSVDSPPPVGSNSLIPTGTDADPRIAVRTLASATLLTLVSMRRSDAPKVMAVSTLPPPKVPV